MTDLGVVKAWLKVLKRLLIIKIKKKSVVFRVKRLQRDLAYIAVLLENGDKFICHAIDNRMYVDLSLFLKEGDTVVYQNNQLIDVCWKKKDNR